MERFPPRPGKGSGFLALGRLPIPDGSPPRLFLKARLARVRDILGPALGPHLVEVTESEGRMILAFAGERWEITLSTTIPVLARRLAEALGRPGLAVEVVSAPKARACLPPRSGAARGESVTDLRERIRKVEEKLAPLAKRDVDSREREP